MRGPNWSEHSFGRDAGATPQKQNIFLVKFSPNRSNLVKIAAAPGPDMREISGLCEWTRNRARLVKGMSVKGIIPLTIIPLTESRGVSAFTQDNTFCRASVSGCQWRGLAGTRPILRVVSMFVNPWDERGILPICARWRGTPEIIARRRRLVKKFRKKSLIKKFGYDDGRLVAP